MQFPRDFPFSVVFRETFSQSLHSGAPPFTDPMQLRTLEVEEKDLNILNIKTKATATAANIRNLPNVPIGLPLKCFLFSKPDLEISLISSGAEESRSSSFGSPEPQSGQNASDGDVFLRHFGQKFAMSLYRIV